MADDKKTTAAVAKEKDNQEEAAPEQEQAAVAYYYLPDENPNGAFYPGVPPGDILQHVYDAQPKWIQKSIAASPMYSDTRPGARKKAQAGEESEK